MTEGKKPYGKSNISSYQIAAWENTIKVNNVDQKKLGYTLSKNYKDKAGEWKHQTINFSGINELRTFVTIVNELSMKATTMDSAFKEAEQQMAQQTVQQPVQEVKNF